MSASKPLLKVGDDFLGKYYILAQTGKGSNGQVFKANHKLMDRLVAIKTVVCLDEHMRKEHLERLQQEARAASALSHPNLVAVYDYGVLPDGNAYTVMDFVEGESLEEILAREGTLPHAKCLDIFMQVASGLEHAHAKGIVHRDIKPSNIMIVRTSDGGTIVKVVDFGIAKLMPWSGKEGLKMTLGGELFGTPFYMSPELCQHKSTDHRTDIYSLGCTMYEALVGESPAADEALMGVLNKHIHEPPKTFAKVRPDLDIPKEFEAIIMKTLAKNPDHRYGSMSELLKELRKFATPKGTGSGGVPFTIRVLVADDSATDAKAIQSVLAKNPDMEVVGLARDGEDAIDQLLSLHPQVVLMDLNMPRLSGIDATVLIKQKFSSVKVIGISADGDSKKIVSAFNAGIDGYCAKRKGYDNVAAAVRTVAYGGTWLDPTVAAGFVRACAQANGRTNGSDFDPLATTHEILTLEQRDEGSFLCALGETYESEGKRFEAEALYRASISLIKETKGDRDESLYWPYSRLANLYELQGKADQAQECYLRALDVKYHEQKDGKDRDVGALLGRVTNSQH